MKATPEWVHEPDAAELLHIKACTLRNMRRERRLDAGTHWVYTTGSIGGPVVYNIPEIREMQRQPFFQLESGPMHQPVSSQLTSHWY